MKDFLADLCFPVYWVGFFGVMYREFNALILQLILCRSKSVPIYSPSDSKGWDAKGRVDDRALS